MATLRQFTERFYSGSVAGPQRGGGLASVFQDLLEELERQITMKIFDANRTLTNLTAEHRRTVEVDSLHTAVFEAALQSRMKGLRGLDFNILSSLAEVLPPHALVRRHPKGDFCIIAPVMVCVGEVKEEPLSSLPEPPFTPRFSCSKGELFVAIRPASFSANFVEVFSPYPGPGPDIDPSLYQNTEIPPLTFPPESDDEGIELVRVKKGDPGAAAKPGVLKVNDLLLIRGQQYLVKAVTGGGSPYEMFRGRDLIVFDRPFPFNGKKISAQLCPPVVIKAKHGFVPRSVLNDFEPVSLKFTVHQQAKRFGCLKISFCSLALNKYLVCHRDSYV